MNAITNRNTWVTSCLFLLATTVPAKAFNVTLDTFTPVINVTGDPSEVYGNTDDTATINQTSIENGGFGNFFQDSSFLLLGAEPTNNILNDNHTVGISAAVSNDIEILAENANQDLEINLDWTFQGNSDGITGITNVDDLDTFSLAFAGVDALSQQNLATVNTELLVTTDYQEQRDYTITVPGGLSTGTYNIVATVVEPSLDIPLLRTDRVFNDAPLAAGPNDNSAAGIGDMNMTLSSDVVDGSSVPFEFSPTTGLLMIGGFWGLKCLQKRKNVVCDRLSK